jgi:hypothetical protein
VLACAGLYLVAAGLPGSTGTLTIPVTIPAHDLMTGLLALTGSVIMSREKYDALIQPKSVFPEILTK